MGVKKGPNLLHHKVVVAGAGEFVGLAELQLRVTDKEPPTVPGSRPSKVLRKLMK